jgi:MFS family permease
MSMRSNIYRLYVIKMAKWFMLTMPILMLYYKDHGFSDAQAFELKAAYSLGILIFEVPSGYFADIIGRRRTLLLGAILGTLGFLIYSTTSGFYAFLLAEITLGIGQSFISGADSAMLFDTLEHFGHTDDYIKYEGRNYTVGWVSDLEGRATAMKLTGLAFTLLAGLCLALFFRSMKKADPPNISL